MSVIVGTGRFGLDPEAEGLGVSLPLAALHEPGTYICDWSGHLLRVCETDCGGSRFASTRDANSRRWTATRISADPHLSRFAARALAIRLGLSVNF
jgi:hypothetical protein